MGPCRFHSVCLHAHIQKELSIIHRAALLAHIRIHSHTHTFKLGCADTLIGIDEIPTGGVVLARGRQTLIVLLLTVQAMVALTGHRFIQFRIKSQSL